MNTRTSTVLGDFSRTIRDEPFFYVYKIKLWLEKDRVSAHDVTAWLRDRYVTKPSGHRYRIVTYADKNGERYVDYILMETCKDVDLVYLKVRWGWSKTKVARGNRVKRKRLTKEQKAQLDAIINRVRDEYFDSL